MRKQGLCANKVTAQLISAFVFAIRIVQSLYYLHPKFQASSHLLWLYSPVCVGPGRKPTVKLVIKSNLQVKLLAQPWVVGSTRGFSSLSDETLNRGPMTIFQDKLLTRTDSDEAGDYVVPNVLSPIDLASDLTTGARRLDRLFYFIIFFPFFFIFTCSVSPASLPCH